MAERDELRCPYCGHEIEEGDVVCLSCGVNFIEGEELSHDFEASQKEEGLWALFIEENREVLIGLLKRLLIIVMLAVAIFLGYGGQAAKWASIYGLLFALAFIGLSYGLKGEFQEFFFWLGLAIGVIATLVVVAYSDYMPGIGGS